MASSTELSVRQVRRVDVQGPAGRLEALFETPPEPSFTAVVCHPHPLFGGTMDNHATYRLAKAVLARGGAALRFNFRGVGRSTGMHDDGRGEVEDVRSALAWLENHHPALPLYACGFSFGSWMALEASCLEPSVRGVLCAGVPFSLRTLTSDALQRCPVPVAVVQGEYDEHGLPEQIQKVCGGAAGPRRLAVIRGATHLFGEDLGELERQAILALSWLAEATQ